MTSFLTLVRALPREERITVLVLLRLAKTRLSRMPGSELPRQPLSMFALTQRRKHKRKHKKR